MNKFEKYSSEDVSKLVKFRNSYDLHPLNILDISFKARVLKFEILIDINDLQLRSMYLVLIILEASR